MGEEACGGSGSRPTWQQVMDPVGPSLVKQWPEGMNFSMKMMQKQWVNPPPHAAPEGRGAHDRWSPMRALAQSPHTPRRSPIGGNMMTSLATTSGRPISGQTVPREGKVSTQELKLYSWHHPPRQLDMDCSHEPPTMGWEAPRVWGPMS